MFSPDRYDSARHDLVVADRTDRGIVRVRGADAAVWLQGLLTNDVEALPVAAAGQPTALCYTAYLTPQGRMITDARALRLADQILLDVPAPLAASLAARLDALIFAEDAQVDDASASLAVVELHGPRAPEVADRLRASSSTPLLATARDDQFGVPGYVVVVVRDAREALLAEAIQAGAQPIDHDTLEVLRVESGRPAFLTDMDSETIPLEAGIEERAISFTKGCYVGQEIIVRVTQRGGGRVAKKLVGLRFASDAPLPAPGAGIRSGDREIGRVTSAVLSPALGVIALGYVHRDFLEPGTRVAVTGLDGSHEAVVSKLPFVAPAVEPA